MENSVNFENSKSEFFQKTVLPEIKIDEYLYCTNCNYVTLHPINDEFKKPQHKTCLCILLNYSAICCTSGFYWLIQQIPAFIPVLQRQNNIPKVFNIDLFNLWQINQEENVVGKDISRHIPICKIRKQQIKESCYLLLNASYSGLKLMTPNLEYVKPYQDPFFNNNEFKKMYEMAEKFLENNYFYPTY